MNTHTKTVTICAWVSTSHQDADMQLNELREFTERSGWTISHEYIDEGYSGANTERPAFLDMMADVRRKRFDILLVWKLPALYFFSSNLD